MASDETSQGEIRSRSVFLALLMRFWLLTPLLVQVVGTGNFDLLLVTEDSDRVTGWFDAKDVSILVMDGGASMISLSSGSSEESGLSLTSSPEEVAAILSFPLRVSRKGFLLALGEEKGLERPMVLNFPVKGLALIRSCIFFSTKSLRVSSSELLDSRKGLLW